MQILMALIVFQENVTLSQGNFLISHQEIIHKAISGLFINKVRHYNILHDPF